MNNPNYTPDPAKPFETEELLQLRASQRRTLLSLPRRAVATARHRRPQGTFEIAENLRRPAELWLRRRIAQLIDKFLPNAEVVAQSAEIEILEALRPALRNWAGDEYESGFTAGIAADLRPFDAEKERGKLDATLESRARELVHYLDIADYLADDKFVDDRP